jgi:hypothetical protein
MAMSPLFSGAAVATMRAVQEANLPHSCQIQAAALGGRQGGVATATWANVGDVVPCRVRVAGMGEVLSADQLKNVSRYDVTLPITVLTVTRKNRLVVSGSFEGVDWTMTLAIEGPIGPKLAQSMRRYLCTPISGEGA